MYHIGLIDHVNKTVLYAETSEDVVYADLRYMMQDVTAFLEMRDDPSKKLSPYRGEVPYVFLPDTMEAVQDAMNSADSSGIDATTL